MTNNLNINCCITDCEREIKKLWQEIRNLKQIIYNGGTGGGACCVVSVNGKAGVVVLTTTDINEGTNKYFTNSRVQIFSDPRYAFKVHQHLLADILDFPSQTGNAGKVLLTDGTNPYWGAGGGVGSSNISGSSPIQYNPTTGVISTTLTQYTNEMAQDAVGSILFNSQTIDFIYNDAGNTISANVKQSIIDAIGTSFLRIKFTVGGAGAPQAGSNSFILTSCNGLPVTNKSIFFWKERELQIDKNNRDFTYNPTTGQINVNIDLEAGEDCVFLCVSSDNFMDCSFPLTSGGLPYTFPFLLS